MFSCVLQYCKYLYFKDYFVGVEHFHPYYELVYYRKGDGTVKIGETEYTFHKESYAVIPPYVKHIEVDFGDTEILYIGFTLNGQEELYGGVFTQKNKEIEDYLVKTYRELNDINKFSMYTGNVLTSLIVIELIKQQEQKKAGQKSGIVDFIVEYVNANYMNGINVYNLAKLAGYSYDYFRHMFFEAMHVNAKDYITGLQIKRAQELLISGVHSVQEVAKMSGFKSVSRFCVAFKNKTRMSPLEYKNKYKSGDVYLQFDLFDEKKKN